jgi:acyl-CoA synthetase (NDP forming)
MVGPNLARMLSPRTVAVVGASESLGMSNNAVLPMLDAGIEPRLINPNRETVYGRPTVPSLAALDEPVDAVLALVNAERSVDVVEEAARLGCGGVVVAAGGFGELGQAGAGLEERLRQAAHDGGLAVVGPNCSGFMNVPMRVNLFTGGRISLRPGPVAVVSQSGFLVRACLAAGQGRGLGFSTAVSSGNETVCGIEDYIEVFSSDPNTAVICLVVEKVRRPQHFFAAVARARQAGKAVIALKLGRTEAARDIMRSHTGAIADENWVYEMGFRQAGVLSASSIDEMMDMAQLLAQIPIGQWRRVGGVGVVTSSGGVAAIAADAGADAGIALPVPVEAEEWLRQTIPGDGALNPLDMTGFVMRDRALLESLFERFSESATIGALVLCWWAAEGDEGWSRTLLEPYAAVAARSSKPLIVTPVEATSIGAWTSEFREKGVLFCRGLESTYRAINALNVASSPSAGFRPGPGPEVSATPLPAEMVATPAGRMVSFERSMRLLLDAGFRVAPYVLVDPGSDGVSGLEALGDPVVVKLADVAHRTELGAVSVGVPIGQVATEVARLRAIARGADLPERVVVQAMISGRGEAFIGLHGRTDLGPALLAGRRGVLVERSQQVTGTLLPLGVDTATELAVEVSSEVIRGQMPWSTGPLAEALRAAERLWAATAGWLGSADINPLVVTDDGLVAVDALILAADIDPTRPKS